MDEKQEFDDESGAEFQEDIANEDRFAEDLPPQKAFLAGESESDELSTEDLEEAYLKALEAMESAEWAVSETNYEAEPEPVMENAPEPAGVTPAGVEIAGADFLGGSTAPDQPAEPGEIGTPVADVGPTDLPAPSTTVPVVEASDPSVKPLRVIEACLFVGGQPLSAKKLAALLDGNNEASDIETLIDELNHEYATQGRPYEIRLVDGGYKLALRAEFEAIRSRVYGVGPRDVKLSQDVLEVLALVAYQQPIAHSAVEACKPNSANVLRQLLRRELISLNRIDQSRNGVEYSTTPRFLQLFGLAHLNELPTPEDLSVR